MSSLRVVDGGRSEQDMADEAPAEEKKKPAHLLLDLARESCMIGTDHEGRAIAVPRHGQKIGMMLKGRDSLRQELQAAYFHRYREVISANATTDALSTLAGMAQAADAPCWQTGLRVLRRDSGIVIDLAGRNGARALVADGRWQIVSGADGPEVFERTRLSAAMPTPVAGGSLDEHLRPLLNVTDESWPLLVGWMVAALIPDFPHPILFPSGEQGTGKTTCARMLVQLLDPSPVPLRRCPRDEDDWVVAAKGSHVVAIDNVSRLPAWLSDALCRAVTGDGDVGRKLYSDDDLALLVFQRVLLMTSIDPGALRGDLADRLLNVELDTIRPTSRKTEQELLAAFEENRPLILGALLDLVASVLEVLPAVRVEEKLRMADFCNVLAALDQVTGMNSLELYREQARDLTARVVEADPVASRVVEMMRGRESWRGTATQLLALIEPPLRPHGWPASAQSLSGRLRRCAPALRDQGVEVRSDRTATGRYLVVTSTSTQAGPLPPPGSPQAAF